MSIEKANEYFRNGNIAAAIEEIKNLPKDIHYAFPEVKTPEAVRALANLPQYVNSVTLPGVTTPEAVAALECLDHLNTLNLPGIITPEAVTALKCLENLHMLKLPGIATPQAVAALKHLPHNSNRWLFLDGITAAGAVAQLSNLPTIGALAFDGITTPEAAAMLNNLSIPIGQLWFSKLSDPRAVAQLRNLSAKVGILYLNSVKTPEAATELKNLPDNIQSLCLPIINQPEAIRELENLRGKNLSSLSIGDLSTAEQVSELDNLPENIKYMSLYLSTPEAVAALKHLSKGVNTIYLYYHPKTDNITPILSEALRHTNVTSISGVELTEELKSILEENQRNPKPIEVTSQAPAAASISSDQNSSGSFFSRVFGITAKPKAGNDMKAAGSPASIGAVDTSSRSLKPEEIQSLKSRIETLENISSSGKQRLEGDALRARGLLQNHESSLAEMAEAHISGKKAKDEFTQKMQDPDARNYYLNIINCLNSSYMAASCVKSGLINHDKTGILGNLGKVIDIAGSVAPMFGGAVQVLGAVIQEVDSRIQEQKVLRLANLSPSLVEMDTIASATAMELIKQNRHKDQQAIQSDAGKILEAIFSGKINPELDVTSQLVNVVTGQEIPASPKQINIQLSGNHTPIDHTSTIEEILKRQEQLERQNSALRKELVQQKQKASALEKAIIPENSENNGGVVSGSFVQRLANSDPEKGRQMLEGYHSGINGRISAVTDITRQNIEDIDGLNSRVERLEMERASKKKQDSCCIIS